VYVCVSERTGSYRSIVPSGQGAMGLIMVRLAMSDGLGLSLNFLNKSWSDWSMSIVMPSAKGGAGTRRQR